MGVVVEEIVVPVETKTGCNPQVVFVDG